MSTTEVVKGARREGSWATACLTYACGSIALIWGALLPSLSLNALGAIMVGSTSEGPLLWRFTIEHLAVSLGLVGSVTMAFVVFHRSRRSRPIPSWKTTAWLSLWPIPTGLLLLGDMISVGATMGLYFVVPLMPAALGAWIPVAAAHAITSHRSRL